MIAKTKRWGNSIGIVLPKKELSRLNIDENEEIIIEIRKQDSPLSALFGAGRRNRLGINSLATLRKEWEAK